jgi:hypothetical protein
MRALVYGYRQLLMDRWAAVLVDGTAGTLLSFLEAFPALVIRKLHKLDVTLLYSTFLILVTLAWTHVI